MRHRILVLFLLPLFGCAEDADMSAADWVLTNGQIYTVNESQPWAEAAVIREMTMTSPNIKHHSLIQCSLFIDPPFCLIDCLLAFNTITAFSNDHQISEP